MKNLILFLLIVTSLKVFASKDFDEKCIRESENYGGQSLFSRTCEAWMQKHAEVKEIFPGHELYAWKGVSILKTPKGMFVIAGSNTQLIEILDIQFNAKAQIIAILNQTLQKRQILIFKAQSNGDVAPQIMIEGPEVSLVKRLKISEGSTGVEILGTGEARIWKWDLTRDSRVLGDISPFYMQSL